MCVCVYQYVWAYKGVAAFYNLGFLSNCINSFMKCLWQLYFHTLKCKYIKPFDFNALNPFKTLSTMPMFSILQMYVFCSYFLFFFFFFLSIEIIF